MCIEVSNREGGGGYGRVTEKREGGDSEQRCPGKERERLHRIQRCFRN